MEALQLNNRLDRNDLAEFCPNLRSVKAFENLANDVSTTIPAAVNAQAEAMDAMGESTGAALVAVRALAGRALAAVAQLEEQAAARRSDRATILALQRRVDDLETLLLNRRR